MRRPGMAALAAALATAGALALPALAGARIVPQRGIAGVNLSMTQAEVRAELGPPDRRTSPRSPIFGRYTSWFYGRTRVDMFKSGEGRVFNVTTTSRAQKTASGVGVGSTVAAVRRGVRGVRCERRHCFVGRFDPGRKVTSFIISPKARRVTRVTIGYVLD